MTDWDSSFGFLAVVSELSMIFGFVSYFLVLTSQGEPLSVNGASNRQSNGGAILLKLMSYVWT